MLAMLAMLPMLPTLPTLNDLPIPEFVSFERSLVDK